MTAAQKWIHLFYSFGERDIQWQLGVYLSGDHNKKLRQEIMSELKGVKVPIAKSGITAIQNAIMESELWQLGDKLRAIGMEDGQNYMVFDDPVLREVKFFWMHPVYGFSPHFVYNGDFLCRYGFTHNRITFQDRNNILYTI